MAQAGRCGLSRPAQPAINGGAARLGARAAPLLLMRLSPPRGRVEAITQRQPRGNGCPAIGDRFVTLRTFRRILNDRRRLAVLLACSIWTDYKEQLGVTSGVCGAGHEIAIGSQATGPANAVRLIPLGDCMPLYWTIDSKERLFTAVGEGEVGLTDATSLLEALAGSGALSYRKLFDGRAVQSAMTADELLAVCAKIRTYHDRGPIGAVAMVGTPEQTVRFARLLGALASADRPMKVFTSVRQARNWLDQQPS
jgi:hypothetical protein